MTQGRRKLSPLARQGRDETAKAVLDETSQGDLPQGGEQITSAVVEDISPDGVAMVVLSGETQACEASSYCGSPRPRRLRRRSLAAPCWSFSIDRPARHPRRRGAAVVGKREGAARQSKAGETAGGGRHVGSTRQRRLDLEASDEIRLTCGKSSLVLRRDGTVIVRGVTIVSRASQSNKIRGGTVSIN